MEKEEKPVASRPKVDASAQKELDKASAKFDKFEEELKSKTHDQFRAAPVQESEQQTKLSSREIQKSQEIHLKPFRTVPDRQVFNEKFREDWNFMKQEVQFIAEHKELLGETIEIWTHPFGGVGASFWKVPTNKPVWGPRYLAEQIRRKRYVRMKTSDAPTQAEGGMTFYGSLIAESQIQRLDAVPVNNSKSIFMGA